MKIGVENVHKKEYALFEYLLTALRKNPDVILYGCKGANINNHTSTICMNIKGIKPKCFE